MSDSMEFYRSLTINGVFVEAKATAISSDAESNSLRVTVFGYSIEDGNVLNCLRTLLSRDIDGRVEISWFRDGMYARERSMTGNLEHGYRLVIRFDRRFRIDLAILRSRLTELEDSARARAWVAAGR